MIQKTVFKGTSEYLKAFREVSLDVYTLPLAFALEAGLKQVAATVTRAPLPAAGIFKPHQKVAFDDTLAWLSRTRVSILSIHVGSGKTFVALRVAAFLGFKTLIIVPTSKKVLQQQWVEEIEQFIPTARVQLLASKSQLDAAADIYIVGSHTVPRLARALATIPFVIVDELHLVCSAEGYKSLLYLHPQYLLGLSATPYRMDGSDRLIELFFGRNRVDKALVRDYLVNVIYTPFEYEYVKTRSEALNWSAILNQQGDNEARNQIIANIVCAAPATKFLILSKRVFQIKDVAQKCRAGGVPIQAVYDDIRPVKDERSLIGSIQKLGVGFSDSSFSALIFAADSQDYHIQYLGRILRRDDNLPTVYDLVDNCFVMRKHFAERKEIYEKSGATIRTSRLEDNK
jgi:superfamily II DNA or RNA helicase